MTNSADTTSSEASDRLRTAQVRFCRSLEESMKNTCVMFGHRQLLLQVWIRTRRGDLWSQQEALLDQVKQLYMEKLRALIAKSPAALQESASNGDNVFSVEKQKE